MKLEVGKSYRTRDGGKVKIVRCIPSDLYPFKGERHYSWMSDGRYRTSPSRQDLVSEWTDEEESSMSSEGRPANWSHEEEADRKCASPDARDWAPVYPTITIQNPKFVYTQKFPPKLEDDPTTVGTALRFNKGKPEWARLQWTEIEEVVKVLTKSAHEKYFDDPAPEGSRGKPNWSKGNSYSMFWESAQRHLKSWIQGERFDAESGLPTLAHCIVSCLILMNWERRGVGIDDRALSRGDE